MASAFKPAPFGRYVLLAPIASGGMGQVFLAKSRGAEGFEKICVIKKILPAFRAQLPAEARDFPIAARMLALLGIGAVRLMTNNPAKVEALAAAGVAIAERVPHQLPANPHNERYLATKRDRAGHLIV